LVLLPAGGPGASLVALHARTGQAVWHAGDDSASYTPAFPLSVAGQRQVIGYLENALVAHEARSGKQLWRMPLSHGYDEHAAWPVYREPHLWISGPFRSGSQLLRLSEGAAAPTVVWSSPLMSNDVVSSVLVGDFLYGFDLRDVQAKAHRPSRGHFRCLEFLTGKERWATDKIGHASVIAADGKLILLNDTGDLILARATPDRYEELARSSVLSGEIGWTPPMLHRGRVYVRNHSRAVCLYLGSPAQLAREELAQPLQSLGDLPQPQMWNVALLLGTEPEYAMDVPTWRALKTWYVVSLIGLLAAGLAAFGLRVLAPGRISGRHVFWTLAYLFGLFGTTILSRTSGEFVFTWMLPLFVALDLCVAELPLAAAPTKRWASLGWTVMFLVTCLAYFLICRRLNLVVHWAFLAGFTAAIPFAAVAHRAPARCIGAGFWSTATGIIGTGAAFSAFYWSSVALMCFKYSIPQ
jgi:outer membrane protein assembly factor BamB